MELLGQEPITDDPEDYAAVVEVSVGRTTATTSTARPGCGSCSRPSGRAAMRMILKTALEEKWRSETN